MVCFELQVWQLTFVSARPAECVTSYSSHQACASVSTKTKPECTLAKVKFLALLSVSRSERQLPAIAMAALAGHLCTCGVQVKQHSPTLYVKGRKCAPHASRLPSLRPYKPLCAHAVPCLPES